MSSHARRLGGGAVSSASYGDSAVPQMRVGCTFVLTVPQKLLEGPVSVTAMSTAGSTFCASLELSEWPVLGLTPTGTSGPWGGLREGMTPWAVFCLCFYSFNIGSLITKSNFKENKTGSGP